MTKGVTILIIAIVVVNIIAAVVFLILDKKRKKGSEKQDESEQQQNGSGEVQQPAPEPETPAEPKFKVGDWVKHSNYPEETYRVVSIDSAGYYELESADGVKGKHIAAATEDRISLWRIGHAKDGDVLYSENVECILLFKGIGEKGKILFYCDCNAPCDRNPDFQVAMPDEYFGYTYECDLRPATSDERTYLMTAMRDAGYAWDVDSHSVIDVEPVEQSNEDKFLAMFDELVGYFNNVVTIHEGGYTYRYLLNLCNYALDTNSDVIVNLRKNFPCVLDYFTNKEYGFALEKTCAWIFALVLVELMPKKRDALFQMAYDYKEKGSEVPTFGWSLQSDPNIGRMCAFAIVNTFYDINKMNDMRSEVGGSMLTYKNDISETFVGIEKFLPPAPQPYIKGYEKRKNTNYPSGVMYDEDFETRDYVAEYYSLETKDSEKLAATIEAIGNKEHHKEHLFGKPRTINHPTLGVITIYPVFGKHNLDVEIPEDGAIADFCYAVGKASTDNRKSQLEIEYGRRRPCEGETDGTASPNPDERALVDFYIEYGDGHRTSYYEKNGDWVDDNGNHIGNFTVFYQNAVYANSYTSGHSAFIEGVGGALMRVMQDKALEIEYAKNVFANGRIITRYHWPSDTIVGRIVGTMMLSVMFATTNCDMARKYKAALEEYEALKNGTYKPKPTEKVNISLSYVCGGYGSCHVDAGEQSLNHYCNKECYKERHPFINVSQRVEFSIEGAGVKTIDGKTSGVWEADTNYELVCPAVAEGEERIAKITMRNENGMRVLNYKLSRQGTKDEGVK